MRRLNATAFFAFLVVLVTSTSGCSSLVTGDVEAPDSSVAVDEDDEIAAANVRAQWSEKRQSWTPETVVSDTQVSADEATDLRNAWLADQRGTLGLSGDPVPDVALERWVSEEERWRITSQCVADAGYPAEISDTGDYLSLEWPTAPSAEMESAANLAIYVCLAKYTPKPEILRPWGSDQYAVEYEYDTEFYLDCLAALGIRVATPAPSKEAFIAARLSGDDSSPGFWVPQWGNDWEYADKELDRELVDLVCPQSPPSQYLYG